VVGAVGELVAVDWILRWGIERHAVAMRPPLEIAPHVLELRRLGGERRVVLLMHEGANAEWTPVQDRRQDAGPCIQAGGTSFAHQLESTGADQPDIVLASEGFVRGRRDVVGDPL